MKYKKQIATGALAFSLLISGTNVFAATPIDLGIKNGQHFNQKQNKNAKNLKMKSKGRGNIVGTISSINGTDFVIDVKNMKTKITSSVDVKTGIYTKYSKNGISVTASQLLVGQKVIVTGNYDATTNILNAKTVKIV